LSKLLNYPDWMTAYGTIPIGYPIASQDRRYRRPLEQLIHWNGYNSSKYRKNSQIDFYESTLRPFAMYRDHELMTDWKDMNEKLGVWAEAFVGKETNPSGELEPKADFSKPRAIGPATKRRKKDL